MNTNKKIRMAACLAALEATKKRRDFRNRFAEDRKPKPMRKNRRYWC